ncbi:hypothetical protein ACHAXR_007614 [Thalassiosira sp. AJA248-18]
MTSNISFFDKLSPRLASPANNSYRTSQSKRSTKSSKSQSSKRSTQSNQSNGTTSSSISVIIGKTFEATTLPDGSQQIIEATKYKRLCDGHIYLETKVRNLEDGTDEQQQQGRDDINEHNANVRGDDGRRDSDVAVIGPPSPVGRQSLDGSRSMMEFTQDDEQPQQHPPRTTQPSTSATSPTKEYEYPQGSFLSTFSSSGSFSPTGDENSSNFASVVTEDHGFANNHTLYNVQEETEEPSPRQQEFVEEYLYDNDPVGLQQWKETQAWKLGWNKKQEKTTTRRPLSPSGGGDTGDEQEENAGWCANYDNVQNLVDDDDDNSLQLMKEQKRGTRMASILWSPSTKRAGAAVRNFFPSTPTLPQDTKRVDGDGYPLNVNYGKQGNGGNGGNRDNDEDEEQGGVGIGNKGNLQCHERMRTRRCKVLTFGILLVVIGTIIAAIVLAVPPSQTKEVEERPMVFIDTKENVDSSGDDGMGDSPDVNDEIESIASLPPMEAVEEDKPKNQPVAAPPPEQPSCIHLKIVMSTNDSNVDNDVNSWSLTRISKDDKVITLKSSDTLPEQQHQSDNDDSSNNSSTQHVYKHCVKPGAYTFTITDSSGNGLAGVLPGTGTTGPSDNGKVGYYIQAEDVTLGISSFFFHEEKMTFTLPFDAEEHSNDRVDGGTVNTACTDDFFLAVKTDKNPGETEWNVIDNDTGNEVLAGGPYELPWAVYTRRACLPNGNYTFNMLDNGGDGVCCNDGQGFFVLSKDGEVIVNSDGKFGMEQSTVFLLGGD